MLRIVLEAKCPESALIEPDNMIPIAARTLSVLVWSNERDGYASHTDKPQEQDTSVPWIAAICVDIHMWDSQIVVPIGGSFPVAYA